MLAKTIAAAVRLARDPRPTAKLAATRTAGALVTAELAAGGTTSPSLPALQPVLIAVLGLDQSSDIQRAGLQVCGTPHSRDKLACVMESHSAAAQRRLPHGVTLLPARETDLRFTNSSTGTLLCYGILTVSPSFPACHHAIDSSTA